MIAISAKWVTRPRTAPAVPISVADGIGPEATKRSMSGIWRPNQTVRIIANRMSSVPDTKVAMAIGFTIDGFIVLSPASAMLSSDHQFQSRPYVVDRADLHVDQMHGQRKVADHLLSDVDRDL